jgi:cell division septation protein DedD
MPNSLRLSIGAAALAVLAACSGSSDQPALSDDLKQDLAKAGGSDMQLAGAASPKLEVVSAAERTMGNVPTPKAPNVTRAPSANRGTRAVVHSARRVAPAAAQPKPQAAEIAPAEAPRAEPAPEPVPSAAGRPSAPLPSTQREPRGGWKTPGQVIRNAPFPINPHSATP